MDFTTTSNKGHAFLKVVLLMRCESDTLRTQVRAGDTVGAVRWRLRVKSHEPDTSGRHVSPLLRNVA